MWLLGELDKNAKTWAGLSKNVTIKDRMQLVISFKFFITAFYTFLSLYNEHKLVLWLEPDESFIIEKSSWLSTNLPRSVSCYHVPLWKLQNSTLLFLAHLEHTLWVSDISGYLQIVVFSLGCSRWLQEEVPCSEKEQHLNLKSKGLDYSSLCFLLIMWLGQFLYNCSIYFHS